MNFILPLTAAILFSLATPLSKFLLNWFGPSFIAGISYIASALFLVPALFLNRKEEKLRLKEDGWHILFIVLTGGILGPFFLLKGLSLSYASNTSILLNLETVFTSLIAVFVLREKGGARLWASCALIFFSGVLVSFEPGKNFSFNSGSIFIALSAFMWAIDNNLTASISIKDPLSIAVIKGVFGGGANLLISMTYSEPISFSLMPFFALLLMGAFSYGGSLVFMIYSQRKIGAARTGLIFGSYPIISFVLSLIFLRENLNPLSVGAFLFVCVAFYITFMERHSHRHIHSPLKHSHRHTHDSHHAHHEEVFPDEHTHEHFHNLMEHSHEHSDDEHHRHH